MPSVIRERMLGSRTSQVRRQDPYAASPFAGLFRVMGHGCCGPRGRVATAARGQPF